MTVLLGKIELFIQRIIIYYDINIDDEINVFLVAFEEHGFFVVTKLALACFAR